MSAGLTVVASPLGDALHLIPRPDEPTLKLATTQAADFALALLRHAGRRVRPAPAILTVDAHGSFDHAYTIEALHDGVRITGERTFSPVDRRTVHCPLAGLEATARAIMDRSGMSAHATAALLRRVVDAPP